MKFEIEDTAFPEIKILHGKRFFDERGFFSEIYQKSDFNKIGIPEFVQDNFSKSSKGVIRGMHWQKDPHGQGKLVQCITGSILDIAVDIRKTSRNFGNSIKINLNENELKLVWIPIGFAHGFQALEDDTQVLYKVTNYWSKDSEMSLNPLDKKLALDWPIQNHILSEKDKSSPDLNTND